MEILAVRHLDKKYPKFHLQDISFSVKKGRIVGLIGRNGAGKSTTLKSILNMVHADGGTVSYCGLNFKEHEAEIKQRIGYAGGAVDYYKKKKLSQIVAITKSFYPTWNEKLYDKYRNLFSLDEEKTPSELSEGMKVKFNLLLALSHQAEFLILDEPTSGLDPISRDELLEIFRYLKNQGISILFSTHITSDLDKCADDITYIREGKLVYTGEKDAFIRLSQENGTGSNLEEIMIHHEKEALHEKLAD